MDNKVITIIGFGVNDPGENYFILDNNFYSYDDGIKYLEEIKKMTDNEINDFVISLPEELRLWIKEGRESGLAVAEWKESVRNEYKNQCKEYNEAVEPIVKEFHTKLR